MDKRTARAMSYFLIIKSVAEKHGIPDEDLFALTCALAVSAEGTGTSLGVVATSIRKAPPEVVESLKVIIASIRKHTTVMLNDPNFMQTIEQKASELGV